MPGSLVHVLGLDLGTQGWMGLKGCFAIFVAGCEVGWVLSLQEGPPPGVDHLRQILASEHLDHYALANGVNTAALSFCALTV